MLFHDAFVNISSFCNLFFLFYKEENRELGAIFCLLLLLLVYNGVREMLNHALRVLFCIASPLHSALGQWPGLIWDLRARQPPAPLE
jgi:hypothetical protein